MAGAASLAAVFGLLLLPTGAWGQARIAGAVFLPDLHPSFPWTEGAKGIEHWYDDSYSAAGLVRLWLANDGQQAVSVQAVKVGESEYPAYETIYGKSVSWWRLRPDPLPPGAQGVVEVRLREAPTEAIAVGVMIADGQETALTVAIENPRPRIGRICFARPAPPRVTPPDSDRASRPGDIVLWCTVPRGFSAPVGLVVDGKRVPDGRYRVLGPWHNALAVVYRPSEVLEYGSFHHFAVTVGDEVRDFAVVRARDDFPPLGTYGYVTPREYAANSLNLYVSFGAMSGGQLDNLHAHALAGVTRVGGPSGMEQGPPAETLGHPAIWAYYLHDEPDCGDYGADELPHKVRIGTYAMEMVARERNCYRKAPDRLTYLTIDQTYKPANWFHYGPIADVCSTDHYPPPGKEKDVFSTVETCRLACSPQMLVFIYRAWWPEPLEPKEGEDRGRMMFGGEERLHMGWGLAGGAQGLISYIHCTEPIGKSIFHGAGEFPDVWHAIGQMYREVGIVAPVLASSWPVDGVVRAPEGVYARALVGPLGMVLVLINESGCESTDDDFIVRSVKPVNLEVEIPGWIRDVRPALVGEGHLEALEGGMEDGRLRMTLPQLDTVSLILVAGEGAMRDLEERAAARRVPQAEGLLRGLEHDLALQARRQDLFRRLPARYKAFVAYGEAEGAYGIEHPGEMWNPRGEKHNAWEWYAPAEGGEHRLTWTFEAKQAGIHYLVFMWNPLGFPLRMVVADREGTAVAQGGLTGQGEKAYAVRVTLPGAGTYTVRLEGARDKGSGARLATAAYLVPEGEASLLPDGVLEPGG